MFGRQRGAGEQDWGVFEYRAGTMGRKERGREGRRRRRSSELQRSSVQKELSFIRNEKDSRLHPPRQKGPVEPQNPYSERREEEGREV